MEDEGKREGMKKEEELRSHLRQTARAPWPRCTHTRTRTGHSLRNTVSGQRRISGANLMYTSNASFLNT